MNRYVKSILKLLLALLIVGAAVMGARKMISTRPQAQRAQRPVQVPAVEVVPVYAETTRIDVTAMGTVIPSRRITVRPEVTGLIKEHHPSLVMGGLISEGEELVRIAGKEYELAVEQQRAQVEQKETELQLEEGRRFVAEQEWQLFESDITSTEMGRDLALRKPQLRRARASLEAARSVLARAELNVERTVVTVPFNSLVIEEEAEKGQLVTPQAVLASLVATDQFWVKVSIPVERLGWIRFADREGKGGSAARIVLEGGGDSPTVRPGKVVRLLGELDPVGRMARLLVAVDDPMGLKSPSARPVLLGAYVRVEIEGKELQGVFRVPRTALREGSVLWILDEDARLEVRPVEAVWRSEKEVLVRNSLRDGDRIIVSRLSTPVPGMVLRTFGEMGEGPVQ